MIEVKDSERLSYSMMTPSDTDLFLQLDRDPEVMRYINGGKPSTMEHIHNWYVPRLESYANPHRGWGLWKVSLQDSGDFLGWVLIRPSNFFDENRDDRDLEVGWRFFRHAWGKGYATEAARAVTDAIAAAGECDYFSAHAMTENTASINIMKKLGMQFVKTFQHTDGELVADCSLYRMPIALS